MYFLQVVGSCLWGGCSHYFSFLLQSRGCAGPSLVGRPAHSAVWLALECDCGMLDIDTLLLCEGAVHCSSTSSSTQKWLVLCASHCTAAVVVAALLLMSCHVVLPTAGRVSEVCAVQSQGIGSCLDQLCTALLALERYNVVAACMAYVYTSQRPYFYARVAVCGDVQAARPAAKKTIRSGSSPAYHLAACVLCGWCWQQVKHWVVLVGLCLLQAAGCS